MPLVVKDRVQETSTTTGTGTFTLAGAVSGFQSFSVIGNGNTTYYAIVGGSEWEVGLGTYTSSGTTLSRNTILESSNGGTAVNFSAGTKNVFVTYPAEKGLYLDASNKVLVNTNTARANFFNSTSSPIVQVEGTSFDTSSLSVVRNSDAATAPFLVLGKARGATVESNTIVQSGDAVGSISFQGNDGTEFVEAARITGLIDGTPGANDMPGALTFATTADGASSPTERMRITSAGNVGIGTTSPSGKFHVANTGTAGTTADNLAVYFSSTNRNSNVYIQAKNTDGSFLNFGDGDNESVGRIAYEHSANYMAFNTNAAERMRIDSSGNVGIGTTSPNYNLQINGSANSYLQLTNSTSGTANTDGLVIGNDGSAANIIQRENLPLILFTNNTERMRIDSSGNLLFNSGYGSVVTAYGCRAWVNFNGIGTVAIRGSGNISSITDNGTGDYTLNFATAMTDINYSYAGAVKENNSSGADRTDIVVSANREIGQTTRLRVSSFVTTSGNRIDAIDVCVSVFR